MRVESSQRIYLLGPSAGTHAERIQMLQTLAMRDNPIYLNEALISLYQNSLKHPYLDDHDLFGELHQFEDEHWTSGIIHRSLKELRVDRPWVWSLRLQALPKDILYLGSFQICFDDSVIGDSGILLLHQGTSLCFRVSPPALTLPQQGPLRVVMLEMVEHHDIERLSVSVLGASHQLIDGPWWLSPNRVEG